MNDGRDLLQKTPWHMAAPKAVKLVYLVLFTTNIWNSNPMNASIVQYLDKFAFLYWEHEYGPQSCVFQATNSRKLFVE